MAVNLSKEFTITGNEGLENINLNGNIVTITNYTNYGDSPIEFEWNAGQPSILNSTIQSTGDNSSVAVDCDCGITVTKTTFANNRNTNWYSDEGGALFVESGYTVIDDCKFTNNFSINGYGGAICISDDDAIEGIDAFVTIRDTTFATADDTIYCEGEMTIEGGVSFAGNITFAQEGKLINNEVMILDLSARKVNDGALINNWGAVSGDGTFHIKVAENQAFGKYLLAAQASGFNGSFLVRCGDDSFDLSLDAPSYEYNGRLYNLTKNSNGELAISIADLNAAKDDWTDRKENGANGLVDRSIGVIDENDIDKYGQGKQVFQNGYLGPDDPVDYLQFTINSAAKLDMEFEATDYAEFNLYTLNSNNELVYVASTAAVYDGEEYEGSFYNLMLDANTYYIEAKAYSAVNYSIEVEEETVFYTKADDGKDNVLIKDGKVNADVKQGGSNLSISASDWVGFGDSNDFYKFELTDAAKIAFDITATGAGYNSLAFLIHKVEGEDPWMYNYSLSYNWFDVYNEANKPITTDALLLDKGTYYIEVVNYSYDGSVDYNFSVNQNSQILSKSDDKENDLLIKDGKVNTALKNAGTNLNINVSDWVGYNDYNDFYEFELTSAANIAFNIGVTGSGYNSMAFLIHKVGGEAPWMYNYSIAYNWLDASNGSNSISTDAMLLGEGKYYIEVVNYSYDGCADYTVTVDQGKSQMLDANKIGVLDASKLDYEFSSTLNSEKKVEYRQFIMDDPGKLNLEFEVNDTVMFTILDKDLNYVSSIWAVGGAENMINGLMLSAGTYYVKADATWAANSDIEYAIELEEGSVFYTNADNGNDNVLIKGGKVNADVKDAGKDMNIASKPGEWVGYGDSNDFYKFELTNAAKIAFDITATGAGYNSMAFLIHKVGGEEPWMYNYSVSYNWFDVYNEANKPITTDALLLDKGTYYIEVVNYSYDGSVDYSFSVNQNSQILSKSDDRENDLLIKDGKVNTALKNAGTNLNINVSDWVGFGDSNDFYEFELTSAANISFDINVKGAGYNSMAFLIHKVGGEEPWMYNYSVSYNWLDASNGSNSISTDALLLGEGKYYFEVVNYSYDGCVDYSVAVNSSKSQMLDANKIGVLDASKLDYEFSSTLNSEKKVEYRQFIMDDPGKLNLEFEVNDTVMFTILDKDLNYVSSIWAVGGAENKINGLMLSAGTYYVKADATWAANSNIEYAIELEEGSAFYTNADNGNDNVLIKGGKVNADVKKGGSNLNITASDWVGYGDSNDFYEFELTSAANIAFDITATGAGYNSMAFLIHKVGGETPWMYNYSISYNWLDASNGSNTISTDTLLLGEGKYYFEVVNYSYDGCVDYSVAVNANKSQMLDANKIGVLDASKLDYEFSSTLNSEKKVEYRQFIMDDPGKLNLEFEVNDTVMFTILDKDLNYVSSIWAVGGAENMINGLMLSAGTYYVKADATWAANSDIEYAIELEGSSVFYTQADNGNDNVLIKNGDVNADVKDAGKDMNIASKPGEWVGYGDSNDFYKFELTNAAKIAFDITATGAGYNSLAFIIHKVDGEAPWMYNYSLSYNWFDVYNEANKPITTDAILLDDGTYYIEVVNYSYDGSVDYSFKVNQNSQIMDKADNGKDNVLIIDGKVNADVKQGGSNLTIAASDWVGYGDSNDFYMFSVDYAGKYSFDIDVKGAGYNSMAFIIHKVDGSEWQYNYSISYNWFDKNITTDAILLDDGVYFFEVVNYTYDGCADYTVSINSKNTTVFDKSEDEGNDSRSSNLALAGTVREDSAVKISNGWVGYDDNIDNHRFRVESAMKVAITISSSDVAALTVYDEYGNWLGYVWNQSGRSSSDAISLEAGKDYYIEVSSPYADFGANVDYDVTIERYIPRVIKTYYTGNHYNIKGDAGNDIITFAGANNSYFATIYLGDGNDILDIQDSYYYWDGNEVECFEVESIEGSAGAISLGNGDDQIIVGKTRELEATSIDMGSGNDEIILKADSLLELNISHGDDLSSAGRLVFGYGNDRLILEAGNEWETQLCCSGISFGSGDDYCEIGANNQVDVGGWNFGSGNDKLVVEEGSLVIANSMDFGADNDTLEINGVLSLNGTSIDNCENISGNGEVVFMHTRNLDGDLEEKLLDAGIKIIDGQGNSGCMGTVEEHADDNPFTATDLHDIELGDSESFWLCGSSIAAESQYGLADEVDYYIFDKDDRSEALVIYAYGDMSIEVLDINGNKTGYELMSDSNYHAVTDWNDGRYLLKLSVNSNSAAYGTINHKEW